MKNNHLRYFIAILAGLIMATVIHHFLWQLEEKGLHSWLLVIMSGVICAIITSFIAEAPFELNWWKLFFKSQIFGYCAMFLSVAMFGSLFAIPALFFVDFHTAWNNAPGFFMGLTSLWLLLCSMLTLLNAGLIISENWDKEMLADEYEVQKSKFLGFKN